jgi:hypothetical protein
MLLLLFEMRRSSSIIHALEKAASAELDAFELCFDRQVFEDRQNR